MIQGPIQNARFYSLVALSLAIGVFITRCVPGSFYALSATSMLVAAVGIFTAADKMAVLRPTVAGCLLFSAAVTSMFAFAIYRSGFPVFIVIAPVVLLAAAAPLYRFSDLSRFTAYGLFLGLSVIFVVAFCEVALNFDFAAWRYPDTTVTERMINDRFLVSSMYANFNDLAYAGITFICLLFFPILQRHNPTWIRIFSLCSIVAASSLCLYFGSRSFALAFILVVIIAAWSQRPNLKRSIAIVSCALAIGASLSFANLLRSATTDADEELITSAPQTQSVNKESFKASETSQEWFDSSRLLFQNNSAKTRIEIHSRYLKTVMDEPLAGLIGFGSLSNYVRKANSDCRGCLSDPHNLILEFAILFGLPVAIAYLLFCAWAGITALAAKPAGSLEYWVIVALAVQPAAGLGPSSSVKFLIAPLLLIAAAGPLAKFTALRRNRSRILQRRKSRLESGRHESP